MRIMVITKLYSYWNEIDITLERKSFPRFRPPIETASSGFFNLIYSEKREMGA